MTETSVGQIPPTSGDAPLVVIIQARMSSQRLPGKVMRQVEGRPLIGHLLNRLEARLPAEVVLATSDDPSDTPLAEYCAALGVPVHRGPLDDVAARFLKVLDAVPAAGFVRICGDSPLMDPMVVKLAMDLFRMGDADLVSNTYPRRSFPVGQSVEVVSAAAFRQAYHRFSQPGHFEHITSYFYANPSEFRLTGFANDEDCSTLSLAVDTPEDLEAFTALAAREGGRLASMGWRDIVRLRRDHAA